MKLTLDLSDETLRVLEVVGKGDAHAALVEVIDRIVEGVTRPGCWERGWVEQVFWDAWTDELEADPQSPCRERPRRRRNRRNKP